MENALRASLRDTDRKFKIFTLFKNLFSFHFFCCCCERQSKLWNVLQQSKQKKCVIKQLNSSPPPPTHPQKKKRNTPIYFNTNYPTARKLVPNIMHSCLLQFHVLKFSLGVLLLGDSQPNFNFYNVNPQIFLRNHRIHLTNWLKRNFYNISNMSFRVIRRWNYS